MAIAPIDLQTLFTQVDKVGKTQALQKDGQTLQQSMQGVQLQKKIQEQIEQVNEAQNTGEGAEKVNDQNKGSAGGEKQNSGKKEKGQQETEGRVSVLKDPSLGKNIDISL